MSREKLPQAKLEEELLLQVTTQNIDPVKQLMDAFTERSYQEQSFEAVEGRRLHWSEAEDELLLQVVARNKGTITDLASIFKGMNYQERSLEAIRCRLKKTSVFVEARRVARKKHREQQRTKHKRQPTQPKRQHQLPFAIETNISIPTHPLIVNCRLREGDSMCSCGKLVILHKENSELALTDEWSL